MRIFEKLIIGKSTEDEKLIAKWTSIEEIYNQFIDWEDSHPGISSFSFTKPEDFVFSEVNITEVASNEITISFYASEQAKSTVEYWLEEESEHAIVTQDDFKNYHEFKIKITTTNNSKKIFRNIQTKEKSPIISQ